MGGTSTFFVYNIFDGRHYFIGAWNIIKGDKMVGFFILLLCGVVGVISLIAGFIYILYLLVKEEEWINFGFIAFLFLLIVGFSLWILGI
jgi:hypothetical protein